MFFGAGEPHFDFGVNHGPGDTQAITCCVHALLHNLSGDASWWLVGDGNGNGNRFNHRGQGAIFFGGHYSGHWLTLLFMWIARQLWPDKGPPPLVVLKFEEGDALTFAQSHAAGIPE